MLGSNHIKHKGDYVIFNEERIKGLRSTFFSVSTAKTQNSAKTMDIIYKTNM